MNNVIQIWEERPHKKQITMASTFSKYICIYMNTYMIYKQKQIDLQ